MRVDRPFVRLKRNAVHRVQQLGAGENAAGLADQIYVIGGTTEDGGGIPYRYRPQDDEWLPLEEHSGGAWSGLAVGALDGYIYAVGGVMEGSLTAQTASYQAIYTVSLPEVNP